MNAHDKGSDARHGTAGRDLPDPRPAPPHSPGTGGDTVPDSRPGPHPGTGSADTGPLTDRSAGLRTGAPSTDPASASGPPAGLRTGVAALSLRYQIGAAAALAIVAVAICVHLGMTFLHVAPSNTVSKQHSEAIENWIYPEFEQNWKLFAPNPLQQNIAVQVRAGIRTADGASRTTGWYDLSAEDGRAIDGNPAPSHTQQNELRRAWDFYVSTHDDDNRPVGLRGALSEAYLRRIMVMRLERAGAAGEGGVLDRVQIRSRTSNVPPPDWSEEKVSTEPVYRTLPWWPLPEDETRGGIG
ncbi:MULTISPECIES: DUF5819 family protein [unclassified Streptomyces]|uniref:DUF5819 family protein n=1 Tax=unclassified Streptomyces TaxID=2593676 RepID=UPI000F6E39C4|nr:MULTISPECIES: DUF5819 family protein [unclassified Streptomyces]AZM61193.1 hypothetical protein DLM49_18005 [Streptomyces sp. WAC 01438]RSM90985.1 hypothetical protein DMA10_27970 [Streptomyces sp. WAC 01420]